uniref:hypothetical protein n=1 Tax=Nocardia suismassiliense TaxID=2077092 RepID=UPI003F498C07
MGVISRQACLGFAAGVVALTSLAIATPSVAAAPSKSCKEGQAVVPGDDYIAKYIRSSVVYKDGDKAALFTEDNDAGRWAPGTCLTPEGHVSGEFYRDSCGNFTDCWREGEDAYKMSRSTSFYKVAGEKYYFDGDDIKWV